MLEARISKAGDNQKFSDSNNRKKMVKESENFSNMWG